MTVPASINAGEGNLAEFAAQSTSILQQVAEETQFQPYSLAVGLASDAVPSMGFRKWVTTVLSTTQVSENVILLSLLFIYRLKKSNPTVRGKPGSEFRLLSVALMLGNKFLDDNTYTNKTWAEVSGINVQEIHIMEVEFLSNMRYSLFVGAQEWKEWHTTLGKFADFYKKAFQSSPRQVPAASYAATNQLPSPPASTSSSPPYPLAYSPAGSPAAPFSGPAPASSAMALTPMPTPKSSAGYSPYPPAPMHPQVLNPPHMPYTPTLQPDFDSISKKRVPDYVPDMQPQAKRQQRYAPMNLTVTVPNFSVHPGPHSATRSAPPIAAPPIPRIPPMEPYAGPERSPLGAYSLAQQQNQLPLPGTRSMSTVYSQQPPPPLQTTSAGPVAHAPSYGPRQTSPYSQEQAIHHSAASSPTTPSYSSQSSPTWLLGNRDSPYRPVRSFNTLLVPPPSNTADAPQLEAHSLGYHTLAKTRSEHKTGLVPYMHPETSWTNSYTEPTPLYRF